VSRLRGGRTRQVVRRLGLLGVAAGLLGGVLGELYLRWLPQPGPSRLAIALVIDGSGSMHMGGKLPAVKDAAAQFVRRQDLARTQVSLVEFSTTARTAAPLGADRDTLLAAVNGLGEMPGGTRIDLGLLEGDRTLNGATGRSRVLLLFTDGRPNDPRAALQAALAARRKRVRVAAVATRDADFGQLSAMTGDRRLVFPAEAAEFAGAFEGVERALGRPQVMETRAVLQEGATWFRLLRAGGWTAILGLLLTSLLSAGAFLLTGSRPPAAVVVAAAGLGCLAGAAGGAMGEGLHMAAAGFDWLSKAGRLLAWGVFAAAIGTATATSLGRELLSGPTAAGLAGGLLAAAVFLGLAPLGDEPARVIASVLLGGAVGLAVSHAPTVRLRPSLVPGTLPVNRLPLCARLR
jgi:uncharacterized protein YegL